MVEDYIPVAQEDALFFEYMNLYPVAEDNLLYPVAQEDFSALSSA